MDFVVQSVSDRFDQPGYRVYQNLHELLLKACKGNSYQDYLDAVLFGAQLPLLKLLCKDVCKELCSYFSVHDAMNVLYMLSAPERNKFSGVESFEPAASFTSHKYHIREVLFSTEACQDVFMHHYDSEATE